jgi:rieske iron-sulfur protein
MGEQTDSVLTGPASTDAGMHTRRDALAIVPLAGLGAVTFMAKKALAEPASERPKEGDLLVAIDGGSAAPPIEPKDVPARGPLMFAWPMDPVGNVVRDGSRLNKVLLLRLDPSELTAETRERTANGVVAYTAICTHTGCDVTGWIADQAILECPCHASHYNPRDGGVVLDGPAPRALPALPLKIVDGKLAVARPFTSRVGFTQG